MKHVWVLVGALACSLSIASTAAAAPRWQSVETIETVRGVAAPDVGINARGNAFAVYSNAKPISEGPSIRLATRPSGGPFSLLANDGQPLTAPYGATDPRVATTPSGATAIAARLGNSLIVTVYAASGPAGNPGAPTGGLHTSLQTGGALTDSVDLGIDEAGRATVAWASPVGSIDGSPRFQVWTASVDPSRAVDGPHALGPPGTCLPLVDVNLRGDVAVGLDCLNEPESVYVRPVGGAFGTPEQPFSAGLGRLALAVDGQGAVHALQARVRHDPKAPAPGNLSTDLATRPAGGSFGAPARLDFVDGSRTVEIEAQEDGDLLVAWAVDVGVRYAFRRPGLAFTGPATVAARGLVSGFALTNSWTGPALMSWTEASDSTARVAAATIAPDAAAKPVRLGIPSPPEDLGQPRFAINDAGAAVGAWEQRCSPRGAYAVMAVALAEQGLRRTKACQDMVAPKVAVRPKRARLVGRQLRVRVGCNEACHLGVRARVLRNGRGKPLATAKIRRGRPIAAARYRTFALRLTKAQAAKVRRAKARGQRVTVRLALPVRDGYGNGTVRRVAVPLRR
jgi:hypothetical protein